jgi:hypothetical protein
VKLYQMGGGAPILDPAEMLPESDEDEEWISDPAC